LTVCTGRGAISEGLSSI